MKDRYLERMKTTVTIALILTSTLVYGQNYSEDEIPRSFGAGMSLVTSGSGQGEGISITGSVVKGRKSLEVGVILNDRDFRISGGDFRYRILLRSKTRMDDNNRLFTPYIQYNLMYQKSMSYAPQPVELGGEEYLIDDPGMVATIGHYLGYGSKIRVFQKLCIDASAGFGLYNGSLDKVNGPGTWGIHYANYGYTYAAKIGVSYTF